MSAAILALAGAATSAAGMAGRDLAQRSGIEPDHGAAVATDLHGHIKAYKIRSHRRSLQPAADGRVVDRFHDDANTDDVAPRLSDPTTDLTPTTPLPLPRAEAVLAVRDLVAELRRRRISRGGSDRDLARHAASSGMPVGPDAIARVIRGDQLDRIVAVVALLRACGVAWTWREQATGEPRIEPIALARRCRETVRHQVGERSVAALAAAAGVDADVVAAWAGMPTATTRMGDHPRRRPITIAACAERLRAIVHVAATLGLEPALVDHEARNSGDGSPDLRGRTTADACALANTGHRGMDASPP
jgi:hypothetical protein